MHFLALLLALVAGQDGRVPDQLAQARARWMAVGPAEYEYTFSLGGLAPAPPFPNIVRCRISRNGASVEPLTWRNPMGDRDRPSATRIDQFFLPYCGVERLFGLIDTFLQKRLSQQVPREGDPRQQLITDYDPILGYPTRVLIDPAVMAADDELIVRVQDFVAGRR